MPMPPMVLSDAQVREFHESGYLVLGKVLDDQQLESLRREEARFRAFPQISLADGKTILPDSSTVFRNQLAKYSEPVRRLLVGGPQLDAIRRLLNGPIFGTFTQMVTKLPDGDARRGEFPWHQDNGYGNNARTNNVTVWVALDDVDENNGCVWVIPGSHKNGLIPHSPTGESWYVSVRAPDDGVPARLRAGEAVAFTGYTLHRSLANRTDHPRRAFFMQYSDTAGDMPQGIDAVLVAGELPYPSTVR